MRRVDDLLTADIQSQQAEHGQSSSAFLTSLPGPWAFVTSGYALTLLLMALLLNRIQHIVVPPRQSFMRRLSRHYSNSRSQSSFRIFLSLILPVNLSSTPVRALIRAPAIYLLWRSLLTFTVILLQVSDLFPSAPWIAAIADWGSGKEMKEVCWGTFMAVCVALSIEALMKGLEGRNSTSSPFNLFGYAFLLHIYSSPFTHQVKPGNQGHTRPDQHVLVTIIIPLLQLTIIQSVSIRQKWAHQRLIPTMICGIITLVHFHYVLFFSSKPYPIVNYLPSLLESLLLVIITLTVSLHVLTQLLLEGHVNGPILGHSRAFAIRWDEDFAVALLRLGTACLDATSAAGLGNEVVGLGSTSSPDGEVELDRARIVDIRNGSGGGFFNEIKRVKAVTATDGDSWIDMVWVREWGRFFAGLWSFVKGSWRFIFRALWKRLRGITSSESHPEMASYNERRGTQSIQVDELSEETVYQSFLRGETISDDDDDYVEDDESQWERSHSRSPTPSPFDNDMDSDWERHEAANLYADFTTSTHSRAPSPSLAPVLLAHVANAGSSPLTRRQFSRLLTRPDDDNVADFIEERRHTKTNRGISEIDETRRNCVICTVEARDIICWPCRCFALCDDCRANLASRSPASKHICPCCRRSVEGYSRIYLP
ncbi:hypothetical protein BU17DRAFT_49653 [Hysterangium stoloniferum]|nr:hypothetical protein BU17DRAFT_49653 [Hysterangium stoloniferum]